MDMSDNSHPDVWARPACVWPSSPGASGSCVCRTAPSGAWPSAPRSGARPCWTGRVRIPVDGGPDFQAELVLPREQGGGADPLAEPVPQPDRRRRGVDGSTGRRLRPRSSARSPASGGSTHSRGRWSTRFERPALHTLIVETMARAVGAEIGAIAAAARGRGGARRHCDLRLPGGRRRARAAGAGGGHPRAGVRHRPGGGRAATSPTMPDHSRRRRYRSGSYLAFPITGACGVLGVVAVTDRSEGSPFDERDLGDADGARRAGGAGAGARGAAGARPRPRPPGDHRRPDRAVQPPLFRDPARAGNPAPAPAVRRPGAADGRSRQLQGL